MTHEYEIQPIDKLLPRLEGVRRSGRGYVARCPAHDDHHPSLSILEYDDGHVWPQCFAGCDTTDILNAVGLEMRDLFPDNGRSDGGLLPIRRRAAPFAMPDHLAPPDRRDAVYRAMAHALGLSSAHAADLDRRKLPRELWAGYATMQLEGRGRAVAAALRAAGGDLSGIPGFYRKPDGHGGEVWALAGAPGMLVPAKQDGLIVGYQIRREDTEDSGKYVWLSSNGKPGGCSPGSPWGIYGPVPRPGDVVWITEGHLKAAVAAALLGQPVLAVAGIGNWHEAIDPVVAMRPGIVVVAYDQEPKKPQVQREQEKLGDALLAAGLTVAVATWDPARKGVDDLLAAGVQPTILPVKVPRSEDALLKSTKVETTAVSADTADPCFLALAPGAGKTRGVNPWFMQFEDISIKEAM